MERINDHISHQKKIVKINKQTCTKDMMVSHISKGRYGRRAPPLKDPRPDK